MQGQLAREKGLRMTIGAGGALKLAKVAERKYFLQPVRRIAVQWLAGSWRRQVEGFPSRPITEKVSHQGPSLQFLSGEVRNTTPPSDWVVWLVVFDGATG